MDMPTIISVTQNAELTTTSLQLGIHPGLDGFDGHFDGAPIVPGVLQIYWVLQFANQYLKPVSAFDIASMEAVKFQQVMTPGIEVRLDLELVDAKLMFMFSSPSKRYSSGKIAINV
jgi:3-hydroxymyristoyl/3-hydroxydecanoyl-(acyl carrier protein) dehydratase